MFHLFDRSTVPSINPEQARERQHAGAVVLDVREPSEWKSGHISGAINIPLGTLPQRLSQLDTNDELVVVCQSGNRSMKASQLLQQAGYSKVQNMAGGMIMWKRSGFSIAVE